MLFSFISILHLVTAFAQVGRRNALLYFANITVKAGQHLQAFAFGARGEVWDKSCKARFCFSFSCGNWDKVGQTMQKCEKKIKGRPAGRKQDAVQCACDYHAHDEDDDLDVL